MKKIFYIAIAAAAIAAVSCARELEFNEAPENGSQALNITFSCGDMQTRATVAGENNENRVDRIDYFIFPYNADGKVDSTDKWVYQDSIIVAESDRLNLEYETTVETGVLSKIFPDGADKAVIFAVANYNGTTKLGTQKTWADLHGLKVGQTFTKDGGKGFGLRWPRPMQTDTSALFFVMTADSVEVTLNKAGSYAVDAEVPLKRLASKVTVEFTYEESIIENKKDGSKIAWVPQYDGDEARVYLSNAIAHSTLGGPIESVLNTDDTDLAGRDIFEYAYDFLKDFGEGAKPYYYTYPIKMAAGDDNQPYLKLVLPWYGYKWVGEGDAPTEFDPANTGWRFYKQKEVYYKIVLPRKTLQEGNRIYDYQVHVDIIGNDQDVEITGEKYQVYDWTDGEPIPSNVATGRYISLDIPKDEYDMYTSSAQILFISSGEVEISRLRIYKYDFSSGSSEEEYYIDGTTTSYVSPYSASTADAAGVTLPNWVGISGTKLVINHTMNTNISSSSVDISPYTFVVTLHLIDAEDDTFDRTVTITQYPPIYVSTIASSSDQVFLNGIPRSSGTDVYNNDGASGIGLGHIGGGTVNNGTSLTVVTVTTLASLDATAYNTAGVGDPIIGDPREKLSGNYPTDPRTGISWGADDLGSEANNYLADYQYAGVDNRNYIAPRLIIASGYGANTGKGSWLRNAERCASYQEAGFPAGRWRLPTEAEMMFIYTLGDNGLIVQPFQGSGYWANSGRYYTGGTSFTNSTSANESRSVRCVYDLWYWGEEDVLDSKTEWGDFQTDYIK